MGIATPWIALLINPACPSPGLLLCWLRLEKRNHMPAETLELPLAPKTPRGGHNLAAELAAFHEFGASTRRITTAFTLNGSKSEVATFVNEFWTSKQRAASRLHEISYRACFKPQLPRFFIERLTQPGEIVYDPFMGRGTTPVEAALLGRVPYGCPVNPLS